MKPVHEKYRNRIHLQAKKAFFLLFVCETEWLFGPIWMLTDSLVLMAVLYRLDREA